MAFWVYRNPYESCFYNPEDMYVMYITPEEEQKENLIQRQKQHPQHHRRPHAHRNHHHAQHLKQRQPHVIEKSLIPEDAFAVNLDVQQFLPEEITVKVLEDGMVQIEGKHEDRRDEHGFVSRHFVRKFKAPEGYNLDKIVSKLSTDGVLTVAVPKKEEPKKVEHREIPIVFTGKPIKTANEQKEEVKK